MVETLVLIYVTVVGFIVVASVASVDVFELLKLLLSDPHHGSFDGGHFENLAQFEHVV